MSSASREYANHLLFPWFGDIENISFRIVTAVIDKGTARRTFDTTDGRIFFLDSVKYAPDVIDGHAEMIEPARIAGTALVERHADVAVAGNDRTSERPGNAAGV